MTAVLSSRPVTILAAAVVGAVFIAGLAVHGVGGGVLLLIVAGLLVLLASASWSHRQGPVRPIRVVMIAAVTALAVAKLVGAL